MELERKELDTLDYKHNPFEWKTRSHGWAGFTICPIWKRGRIREVFIYPTQQPNAKYYYYIKYNEGWCGLDFEGLFIESEKKINNANITRTYFCKEHKCMAIKMLVPKQSSSFL
jgi:hypothetical protein